MACEGRHQHFSSAKSNGVLTFPCPDFTKNATSIFYLGTRVLIER
jgi:hypothetical protein